MKGADAFKLFLGPTVPTLLVTVNEGQEIDHGEPPADVSRKLNAAPSSWVQKVSYDPPLVVLAQKPGNDTLRNLRRDPRFTMNVLSGEKMQRLLLCGQRPPYGESELLLPGVDLDPVVTHSTLGPVAVIDGAVQWAVCRALEFRPTGDHVLVIAEVERVFVDEVRLHRTGLYWNKKTFAWIGNKFEEEGY